MQAALSSTHSRLPAVSGGPIERLPDELLSAVLIWHAITTRRVVSPFFGRPRRRYPFRWFYVLRVCRHWLQVALATPALWHTIDIVNPNSTKWLNCVLSLIPQTVPLDLLIASSELTTIVLPSLIPRSTSIRRLELPDDIPITILKLDMPSLIELEAVDSEVSSVDTPPSRKLALPPRKFPSLRVLRISRFVLADVAIFKQLRVLDLRFCALGKKGPSTFDALLGLLDECSQLEELRLYRILSNYLDKSPNVSRPATPQPSKLKKLVLHDHPPYIALFLSFYFFPETTTIRLSAWALPSANQIDIVALFNSLLPRDRSQLPILRAAKTGLVATNGYHTKLAGYTTQPEPYFWWFKSGGAGITLKLPSQLFPSTRTGWRLVSCVNAFMPIFARAPLITLSVEGCLRIMPHPAWGNLFDAFPDVRDLRGEGPGAPTSLFHCLGGKALPKLETVQLMNVDFQDGLFKAISDGLFRRKIGRVQRLQYIGMLFNGSQTDHKGFEDEREHIITDMKHHVDTFDYVFADDV